MTTPNPCVICELLPEVIKGIPGFHVVCPGCGMEGPTEPTKEDAIEGWNDENEIVEEE